MPKLISKSEVRSQRSEVRSRKSEVSFLSSVFCPLFSVFCVLSPQSVSRAVPLAKITVEAGDYTRIDTPVTASLDGVPLGSPADKLRLVEVKGSRRVVVPVQLEAGSPPKLWWILSGKTEAGTKRIYELEPGSIADDVILDVAPLLAVKNDSFLQIQTQIEGGNKNILRYNHAIVPAPAGQRQ